MSDLVLRTLVFLLTSESLNIVLNPMQRQSLISEPKIHFSRLFDLLATTQKSPRAETVVDADAYDWLANLDRVLYHEGDIVSLIDTAALEVAATVNPESNRELLILASGRSNDIDIEAVL